MTIIYISILVLLYFSILKLKHQNSMYEDKLNDADIDITDVKNISILKIIF